MKSKKLIVSVFFILLLFAGLLLWLNMRPKNQPLLDGKSPNLDKKPPNRVHIEREKRKARKYGQIQPKPVGSLTVFKGVFSGTSAGTSYNFPTVVGTDLQGNTWTGSHSLIADGAIMFEGQSVTKSRALLNIRSGNIITTNLTSMYFQSTDHSIYKIIADPEIAFVPSTQTSLPDNPKVGQSGIIGTLTSAVATPTAMTWALNTDLDGASVLALSSSLKTASTAGPTEIYSYHLDATGVPTKVVVKLNNGTTIVTLSGDRK